MTNPFSKLTSWIFSVLAIAQGMGHAAIVAWLGSLGFVPDGWASPLAALVLILSAAVPLFSHAANGTGGTAAQDAPHAETGLLSNLTTTSGPK